MQLVCVAGFVKPYSPTPRPFVVWLSGGWKELSEIERCVPLNFTHSLSTYYVSNICTAGSQATVNILVHVVSICFLFLGYLPRSEIACLALVTLSYPLLNCTFTFLLCMETISLKCFECSSFQSFKMYPR